MDFHFDALRGENVDAVVILIIFQSIIRFYCCARIVELNLFATRF